MFQVQSLPLDGRLAILLLDADSPHVAYRAVEWSYATRPPGADKFNLPLGR